MNKAEQIELAKYIYDVMEQEDYPHDAEHIANCIELFYSDYKDVFTTTNTMEI